MPFVTSARSTAAWTSPVTSMSCEPRSVTRSWFSKWCFTSLLLSYGRAFCLLGVGSSNGEQPWAGVEPVFGLPKTVLVDVSLGCDRRDLERQRPLIVTLVEPPEYVFEVDHALPRDQVPPRSVA